MVGATGRFQIVLRGGRVVEKGFEGGSRVGEKGRGQSRFNARRSSCKDGGTGSRVQGRDIRERMRKRIAARAGRGRCCQDGRASVFLREKRG